MEEDRWRRFWVFTEDEDVNDGEGEEGDVDAVVVRQAPAGGRAMLGGPQGCPAEVRGHLDGKLRQRGQEKSSTT